MKTNIRLLFASFALFGLALLTACDFSAADKTYSGDVKVKFNSSEAVLFAEEEQDVQTIGVSTLKPVSEAKTYSFTVVDDEFTTAQEGVHFTFDSNSFTIPANEVLGEIPITLIKANLGDAPSLHLQITANEVAAFNSNVVVTLRQFFPYVQEDFVGDFNLVYPWWFGDSNPRVVTTVAGDDENTIIVQNMLGSGTDIEFTMDNSDPTNFTVSFDRQAAWVSANFGDARMFGQGTFDAENYFIQASATHTVAAGSFGTNPFTLTKIQN